MELNFMKFNDRSGKCCREEYVKKHFPDQYQYIIEYCKKYNFNILFKEKIYLSINKLESIPKCENKDCNRDCNFIDFTSGYYKYCSTICFNSNLNSKEQIKQLKIENSLKKYGTPYPQQSQIVKNKALNTNQERYGTNSPMQSEDVQDKRRQTFLKRYGVTNPSKSPEILARRITTFKENFESYKENYTKTCMETYGVDHPWKVKEIHAKTIEKSLETRIKNLIEKFNEKLTDYPSYIIIDARREGENGYTHFDMICSRGHEFYISAPLFRERHKRRSELCTICNPVDKKISGVEINLYNYVCDIYKGEILQNIKNIIYPYEIDIYLPELNIGIEFNGLYFHSESVRGKDYHYKKNIIADQNDVKLIMIWEDDWFYNSYVIKKNLLNILIPFSNNINDDYKIKEVLKDISIEFIKKNTLDLDINFNISLGLYINDELNSILTLNSDVIVNIFDSSYNVNNLKKLLDYYIKLNKPKKLISYCNDILLDNFYIGYGFSFIRRIGPIYWKVVNKRKNLPSIEIGEDYIVDNGGLKMFNLLID